MKALSTVELAKLKADLESAVTLYDAKQMRRAMRNPRAYYNHNALSIYLDRVDAIMLDVQAGAEPRLAVIAAFSGTLLNAALRAMRYEPCTEKEEQEKGMVYRPVKAK